MYILKQIILFNQWQLPLLSSISKNNCLLLLFVLLLLLLLERFSNDCRKTKTKAITPTNHDRSRQRDEPITITCNSLEAREKSRVHGAIGFGFDFHWLKNWRDSFKPITKRSNRNHVITFDGHLKTALLLIMITIGLFFPQVIHREIEQCESNVNSLNRLTKAILKDFKTDMASSINATLSNINRRFEKIKGSVPHR